MLENSEFNEEAPPWHTLLKQEVEKEAQLLGLAKAQLIKLNPHWEDGDIALENGFDLYKFKGREMPEIIQQQLNATRSSTNHAGIMLQSPGPNKESEMAHIVENGTEVYSHTFERSFYTTGYRFNLARLATSTLKEYAKKEKGKELTPNELEAFLRDKARTFSALYREEMRSKFIKIEESEKSIKNTKSSREAGFLTRSRFFTTPQKNLKERLRQIDQDREVDKQDEMCSEFAAKEAARYLNFLEKQLQKELHTQDDLLKQPFHERTNFKGIDTGTLTRQLKQWEKDGIVKPIQPAAGLFKHDSKPNPKPTFRNFLKVYIPKKLHSVKNRIQTKWRNRNTPTTQQPEQPESEP